MKIATFADVHGKLLLPFVMTDAYQKIFNEKIDLIFQCGDLGAFPRLDNMDRATINHAKRDIQELGFKHNFNTYRKSIDQFLQKLNISMVCVRGNHEDHEFLDDLENKTNDTLFSIDAYQKVWICKSGTIQTYTNKGENLKFMGIGRIGNQSRRVNAKYIQEYEKKEIDKSLTSRASIDVLLSHDVSCEMTTPGYGMKELRTVLDNFKPTYHCYGHDGKPFSDNVDYNSETKSIKVKELEFNQKGYLDYGSMIIIEKNEATLNYKVVPLDFLQRFTKYEWENMIN